MRAAVYKFVHSHNICDTVDTELSDQPLFCNRKINTAKDFRKALIFMHDSVLCANGFCSRKFGLKIDERIWSIPSLITKETRLRVLQWNILLDIFPTNVLLCKMKMRDDQMCSYCNDVVDYMWEKKSYKDVWMCEREEYCNDGWIFLNKRPTVMCLAKKERKKKWQSTILFINMRTKHSSTKPQIFITLGPLPGHYILQSIFTTPFSQLSPNMPCSPNFQRPSNTVAINSDKRSPHARQKPLDSGVQTIWLIDDRLYIAILRSLEQTHCARMWFYMSD